MVEPVAVAWVDEKDRRRKGGRAGAWMGDPSAAGTQGGRRWGYSTQTWRITLDAQPTTDPLRTGGTMPGGGRSMGGAPNMFGLGSSGMPGGGGGCAME